MGALGVALISADAAHAQTPTVNATVATISGGSMSETLGMQGTALNADRTLLYVSEGTRTTIWSSSLNRCSPPGFSPTPGAAGYVGIFNTSSRARIADAALTAGFPIHSELDSSTGRIYVVASTYGVYAFQGTAQVAASPAMGGAPHDIGIDPTTGRGVVTNTFDQTGQNANRTYVSLVDLSTLQVLNVANTGGFGPHKASVDPVRHLAYISHAEFTKVDVIDTQTGQMLRQFDTGLGTGGAQNAIDLSRRRLYVAGNAAGGTTAQVVAIDLSTERPVNPTVLLPSGGHGMRVDPATGLIWVVLEEQGQVSVIDPDTVTERARIPVGHCPYYLDIDATSRLAYVTNQGDNTISVLDMTKVPGSSSLPAPANLTYTLSGTTVNLAWSAVSGAASYDIEAGSAAGLSDLAVLNTTSLGFTAVAPPGTYYVRVRARGASGSSSSASNEVTITIGGGGACTAAPGPPGALQASAGGDTVVLTWSGSVGAPTTYVLEAGAAPGGTNLANLDLGSAQTSYSASGVPRGTYYVRLRATNACGTSATSNEVVVTVS